MGFFTKHMGLIQQHFIERKSTGLTRSMCPHAALPFHSSAVPTQSNSTAGITNTKYLFMYRAFDIHARFSYGSLPLELH